MRKRDHLTKMKHSGKECEAASVVDKRSCCADSQSDNSHCPPVPDCEKGNEINGNFGHNMPNLGEELQWPFKRQCSYLLGVPTNLPKCECTCGLAEPPKPNEELSCVCKQGTYCTGCEPCCKKCRMGRGGSFDPVVSDPLLSNYTCKGLDQSHYPMEMECHPEE